MQSLLDLFRGRLQHTVDGAEWTSLLNVAEEENVLPWAAERLRSLDGQHTLEQKQRLNEIRREAQVSSFVWTETLKGIAAAFHQADLPMVSLKGPCLAERLYGDAALRTCYDLDLLVRQSDLARAERLLTDIGFLPDNDADDYHRRWRRKAAILELHHNLENPLAFDFDMDAIWARTLLSQFQGVPIRLLGVSDEMLYLCFHAVRHRFERLCLILDLDLAFRLPRLPPVGVAEWSSPVFDNIFALGWMMAACLDPEIAPEIPIPQAMRASPADCSRLKRLADRLWQELLLAPPKTLDWAAQHRFYLELENPGRSRFLRRWRHRRILLTRLIDADFAFAGRFNLHRNWQVRLLRPIRLLMKRLRASSGTV
jgi:hypothetical protein